MGRDYLTDHFIHVTYQNKEIKKSDCKTNNEYNPNSKKLLYTFSTDNATFVVIDYWTRLYNTYILTYTCMYVYIDKSNWPFDTIIIIEFKLDFTFIIK